MNGIVDNWVGVLSPARLFSGGDGIVFYQRISFFVCYFGLPALFLAGDEF